MGSEDSYTWSIVNDTQVRKKKGKYIKVPKEREWERRLSQVVGGG